MAKPLAPLNPRQQEALEYTTGPLLVLAGAGSGKTAVITRKIAYLIEHCQVPAQRIAALTFTNKAAREMKHRVASLVSSDTARGLTISTFHTFGLNLLRIELKATHLKANFSILDGEDSKRLLADLMHKDNLSGADNKALLAKVIRSISDWKNDLITPAQAMATAEDADMLRFAQLYELYERHLQAYNAVDFDDLIVQPTLLLQRDAQIRDKWQNKIRYLLVDEYQDTNTAQYALVKLLVGVQARFTAVGDDDQSIYAWRGAKPENMAKLADDFVQLKVVKLEQNYRSTQRILSAANAVIGNNPHLFEKALWSNKLGGDVTRLLTCVDDNDEAERVAHEIINHKLMHGQHWKDYAILYRGNYQSRPIEAELRRLQVPYKISGGLSFFARAEIRDLMCYLRLMINPTDDSAFLRIINTPKREIGPVTLEQLGVFAQSMHVSLLEACSNSQLSGAIRLKKAAATLAAFAEFIGHFQRELLGHDDPVPMLRQMIEEIGYIDMIRAEAATPQSEKVKIDNIESLLISIQTMLEREENADERTLENVIRKLVLLDMLEQQQEEEDVDRVNLLTLHAAKGLEFPFVYIVGLEEDFLPHRNSIIAETVEEERRLMYVGITRAKDQLTLTMAKQRRMGNQLRATTPSRFLDEFPEDELDWVGQKNRVKQSNEDPKAQAQRFLDNLKKMLE